MRIIVLGLVLAGSPAMAETCPALAVDVLPDEGLQIVAWLEDDVGRYVDTLFITEATGRRGLGNRPGALDLHSGPLWPHGRRLGVFPVWAHRHGIVFPFVEFQDGNELSVSHAVDHCSREEYYDRPLLPDEFDTLSGASQIVHTDKGKLSATQTSLYPPRADLQVSVFDDPSVAEFASLNPFDAVSQATPGAGVLAQIERNLPFDLAAGNYVVHVEVSKERDFNASYTEDRYPSPLIAFHQYGVPYRGQPSVIYEVPIAIGAIASRAVALDYVGYSDPDALDGLVRAPDSTITSAADRLGIASSDGDVFRLRVRYTPDRDLVRPAAPSSAALTRSDQASADITFIAPGDDDVIGTVTRYEIRYLANATITEASFTDATVFEASIVPVPAGELQTFTLTGLEPGTPYSVGIRAFDDCRRSGSLTVIDFATEPVDGGCGCTTNRPDGLALALGLLALRRRRRR